MSERVFCYIIDSIIWQFVIWYLISWDGRCWIIGHWLHINCYSYNWFIHCIQKTQAQHCASTIYVRNNCSHLFTIDDVLSLFMMCLLCLLTSQYLKLCFSDTSTAVPHVLVAKVEFVKSVTLLIKWFSHNYLLLHTQILDTR